MNVSIYVSLCVYVTMWAWDGVNVTICVSLSLCVCVTMWAWDGMNVSVWICLHLVSSSSVLPAQGWIDCLQGPTGLMNAVSRT